MLKKSIGKAFLLAVAASASAFGDAPILGVCTHFGMLDTRETSRRDWRFYTQIERKVRELGVDSIRDEAYWTDFESKADPEGRGPVFPEVLKQRYLGLIKEGIQPLIVLGYGHDKYQGYAENGGIKWDLGYNAIPTMPASVDAFAAYCKCVATAFKGEPEHGKPRITPIFELWNEWDQPLEGKSAEGRKLKVPPGSFKEYIAVAIRGAEAIREVLPEATILTGGITSASIEKGVHLDLLRSDLCLGNKRGKPWVDGIAIHPYNHHGRKCGPEAHPGCQGKSPECLAFWVKEIAGAMDGQDRDRKFGLYITEIGWPAHTEPKELEAGKRFGIDEAAKARFITQTCQLLSAIPRVKGIWWYELLDGGHKPEDSEHHYGILQRPSAEVPEPLSLGEHPAYKAFQDFLQSVKKGGPQGPRGEAGTEEKKSRAEAPS